MSKEDMLEDLERGLSRRDLMVKGGLLAAGATLLGGPAASAFGATQASKIKIAVVTHGDTGAFWSVFKKGVDQAAKDLKSRGVSVTQVYANNDVAKQVSGINAAIAAKAQIIATSVPDPSALRDSMAKASAKGIELITVNSGLGYLVIDSRNAGKRFDLVVAAMLLIGVVGLLLNLLIERVSRLRAVRWGFREEGA
jgi:ABC-type sugar transport system substrate-binding protein